MKPSLRPAAFCFSSLLFSPAVLTALSFAATVRADDASPQYYEIRTYLVDSADGEAALDAYLADSLLPALERLEVGPVGVLASAPIDENPDRRLVVVIPLDSPDKLSEIRTRLADDRAYQASSREFRMRGSKNAAYRRIVSELAVAMDGMKTLSVQEGTLDNQDRIYELRTYESPSEGRGELKVEMFNEGELDIFLKCGIQPIFLAQTLVGPQMPSLTYLTVYADDEQRLEAWATFRTHPDWKEMSAMEKYDDTVSAIDKFILKAKPYSQM